MRAFEKPCFDKKVAWLNSQWGINANHHHFNTDGGIKNNKK